jgi:hypothetical protein
MRPEVIIGLADLASEIATSLRAFAQDRPGPTSTPSGAGQT